MLLQSLSGQTQSLLSHSSTAPYRNAGNHQSCTPIVPRHGGHIDLASLFLENYLGVPSSPGALPSILVRMELLLNLVWLLMVLPACWLWQHKSAPAGRRFASLQCLLALGCALVILFPVISATDDLHAMRAEMDESQASKRSVSHRTSDRPSAAKAQSQPYLAAASTPISADDAYSHSQPSSPTIVLATPPIAATGRAPPVSFPG